MMVTWAEKRRYGLPACVYCGEPADTRDHVIPQHWRHTSYTVPACMDCNCRILRGVPLFTIEDRQGYVAMRKPTRSAPQNTPREPRGTSPGRVSVDPSWTTFREIARRRNTRPALPWAVAMAIDTLRLIYKD